MILPFLITIFLGLQLLDFPNHFLPTFLNLFKEYPILYAENAENVKNKFKELSQEPDSCIAVAHTHEQNMAGFIYGVPLKIALRMHPAHEKLFKENNIDPSSCYHIKDLIIAPEYRKQAVGTQLFKKLEKLIKKLGYSKMSLCIIEHKQEDHPLKPVDHYNPELFWQKQGFYPTSIEVKKSWLTLIDDNGTSEMQEHNLRFWIKEL